MSKGTIRNINEKFLSDDYDKITKAKDGMGLTLREFILKAAEILPIYEAKEVPKQRSDIFEVAIIPANGRVRPNKSRRKSNQMEDTIMKTYEEAKAEMRPEEVILNEY